MMKEDNDIYYYFTSGKFGIDNLKSKRLKISDFNNVNDPFELLGVELRDKVVRKAVSFEKSQISEKYGLLCFSVDKYNPVQWAHYADNHKGICLGFKIPKCDISKVEYVKERLSADILDSDNKNRRLLTTKFEHWSYEKEYRMILELSKYKVESSSGLRFIDFSNNLVLKEIYIGCKSDLSFDALRSVYISNDKSVIVKRTRPSFRDFRIVWDQKSKSVRI